MGLTASFEESREIVVVGGGPGGSTVAAMLARRGRDVLLLERDRFPRFHIGESLLPCVAPILRDLGLENEVDRRFLRKPSARFVDDARDVDDPRGRARFAFADAFPPAIPYAWQVPRDAFDDLLLRNAQRLGAEVRQEVRVREAIVDGDRRVVGVVAIDADGRERRIASQLVVDATGRESLVAKHARTRHRVPGLDKTAIFTQFRGGFRNAGDDAGQIEILVLDHEEARAAGAVSGWGWFIPFKDGRSSAGFVLPTTTVRQSFDALPLSHARHDVAAGAGAHELSTTAQAEATSDRLAPIYAALVARSPWMTKLLGDATRIEPVRAAADYSFRVSDVAGDGWLAVGDAGGFLDPLFSSGANLAMAGAVRAASAIDAALAAGDVSKARFDGYEREVRAAAALFLGPVQAFYRGELQPFLFAERPREIVRRMITTMLAGDVFPSGREEARWVGFFRDRFPATL